MEATIVAHSDTAISPEIKRKHVTIGLTIFKFQFLLSNGKGVRHFLLATHPRKKDERKKNHCKHNKRTFIFPAGNGQSVIKTSLVPTEDPH